MRCQHCKRRKISRPRFLCDGCFETPRIRRRYPLVGTRQSRGAVRGVGGNPSARPPETPTDAPTGTAAKLLVMGERAAAGLSLFHPADAVVCGAAMQGGGRDWLPARPPKVYRVLKGW